jgi:hypothetical protein
MTPFFGSRNILILFVGLVFCLVHNLRSATLYVDAHNPGPVLPYNTWANAATNVQDAVDLAVAGDEVLVTNGLYQTGGRALAGGTTNRVAITNAILVHSVNGPYQTFITGYQPPGTTNGPDAIRCVHLAAGAVLSGFTLANGATMASGSDDDQRGGGVVCESRDAIITNCVLTANVSWLRGGGVYSGSLDHCWLAGNRSVRADGGGAGGALLNSCVISSNQAAQGGGAASSTLYNCTVAGNYAFVRGSGSGVAGGTANCQAYNTII